MHYSDSEFCPVSFEAYRKRVIGETSLSLDAAKRILREHGVDWQHLFGRFREGRRRREGRI